MIIMKRKGFTLIELLAVIVVLAIIALITTPTILGVIEKARKGASEQSALGYIDAVEKQVAINQVKNENLINDGTYNVPMTGITVKGEAPTKGWLTIEKGLVINYSFVIGKYVVTKGSETVKGDEPAKSEEVTKTGPTQELGTEEDTYKAIVYLDPTDLTKYCDESNSISTTGTKEGCMKWYAYSDNGTNYEMILDHNTTATVAWNSTGNNSEMKEVKKTLEEDTEKWNSSLNTRLITANEVAIITNNINFNSSSSIEWFCFDTNESDEINSCSKTQGTSKYAWLFDYTKGCTNYGCNVSGTTNYGYWTSTPVYGTTGTAWRIYMNGSIDYSVNVDYAVSNGVRPVITVLKNKIS